jgi:hypothetical protein
MRTPSGRLHGRSRSGETISYTTGVRDAKEDVRSERVQSLLLRDQPPLSILATSHGATQIFH